VKQLIHEEVYAAARLANADTFIRQLPDGYQTVLTGDGANLSQGQRQLLNIARAAVSKAPILILDEATAFADPDNEAKVQKAFTKLSAGKTVIMIAHRLSSVVDADRICVLKDGGIVEQGTHEALLTQGGLYAHMWEEYNKSVSWKVGKGEK
jgi:ATP-binding cassette subfamily B protein